MPYRGMPGITKGFNLTGGPQSQAGQMADSGTLNEHYGTLRAKSSSINKIPGAGLILDAKKFAAEQDAQTLREKAEWDAKALSAKYDYYADTAAAKGNSAMMSGITSGLGGLGMAAFNLSSGGGGGGGSSNPVTNLSGSWGDMSNFVSGFGGFGS